MLKLEDIKKDAQIRGLESDQIGSDALNVFYVGQGGWRLHGPTVRRRHSGPDRGHGVGRQTERTARLHGHFSALGCRTLFRLAGEMPQVLEKHRTFAQHQPAVRHKAFLALFLRR